MSDALEEHVKIYVIQICNVALGIYVWGESVYPDADRIILAPLNMHV